MEENYIESINKTLELVNTSLERLGFNGAVVRNFGAIEGLTLAVRDTGAEITAAINDMNETLSDISNNLP